jgi:tetratricopeptide (TPR) repeat protein
MPSLPSDLPAIWNVPFRRNPHFTGREHVLSALHKAMKSSDVKSHTQVLCGLGGIGKTHTALEYIYRHADEYGIVWWIAADDSATISIALSSLAERLGLGLAEDASLFEIRVKLGRALAERSDWLLVFDNAQSADQLAVFLPPKTTGSILITSRNPNWRDVGHSVGLRVFSRDESVEFLKARTNTGESDEVARTLAQALGDLPLALEQAAALIEQSNLTFAEYLSRFEAHWAELLRSGRPSGDYPDTVAMTWELAFREIETSSPTSADLLNLCSFLSSVEIPRAFLRNAANALPRDLGMTIGNMVSQQRTVDGLLRFSLIEADENSMVIHRLVAALARDRMEDYVRSNWAEIALRMMEGSFNFDDRSVATWAELGQMLPHALAVAHYAEAMDVAPGVLASLLNEIGHYLLQHGQYSLAKEVLERAMAQNLRVYGENNPRLSAIANNLGRVLRRLGDLAQARAYFESAIAVAKDTYGTHHPHVAEVVNNYGTCLQVEGDIETARRQFEWSLAVCASSFGFEHPKVANVINNLGYALKGLGDIEGADAHFKQALSIAESTYGPSHPNAAAIMANMGVLAQLRGNHAEAREHFLRALDIDQAAFGNNHPDVARDLAHLGILLHATGDHVGAKDHLERAIAILERVFGPNHRSLITRLNALGRVHQDLGDHLAAAKCFERSSQIVHELAIANVNSTPAADVAGYLTLESALPESGE